jgi:hypothetical protein
LSSGVRAAKAFDAAGQIELATIARAVVVAEISIFIALFFLSDGPDQRYWILFGIGGALGGLAPRQLQVRQMARGRRVIGPALTRTTQ